jgi:uncharacterized protein (UPF0276 family)
MQIIPDTAIGWGWNPALAGSASEWPDLIDFLEVIPESLFRAPGGLAAQDMRQIEQLRTHMPLSLHGVGFGLGGAFAFLQQEAKELRALTDSLEPSLISQHCCFVRAGDEQSFELLPVPLTRARLSLMCEQVDKLQHVLKRPILLENVTRYVDYRADEMTDCAFLAELCRRTGAQLLFDVNNHIINCANRGADPGSSLSAIDPQSVAELHMAGHSLLGDFLFDSHTLPIAHPTWELLAHVLRKWGPRPIVLECDDPQTSWEAQRDTLIALRKFVKETLAESSDPMRQCTNQAAIIKSKPPLKVTRAPKASDRIRPSSSEHLTETPSRSANLDRDFVRALRAPQSSAAHRTQERLHPNSAYRLHAYQLSHFSRVTYDLLETVLLPLKGLLSEATLVDWLTDFFRTHPPKQPHLFDNLGPLVDFAQTKPMKQSDATEREAIGSDEWAAVIAVCTERWSLLHAANNSGSNFHKSVDKADNDLAHNLRLDWPAWVSSPLSPTVMDRLLGTSGAEHSPVFGKVTRIGGASLHADGEVLMLLCSPNTGLSSIRLPRHMRPLAAALASGASVDQACAIFADQHFSHPNDSNPFLPVTQFFATMTPALTHH